MPDLQPTPAADPSAQHLRSLYKMSVTAGLGSTDYVAINGRAITAAVLGCFSWLALFTGVLLTIPLVAVIFGVLGLRQIADSNGTQGGKIWAILGILLALGFGGTVIAQDIHQAVGHRADERRIVACIAQLQDATRSGNVDQAYALFSPEFQRRVTKDAFGQRLAFWKQNPIGGNLVSIRWNDVPFQFETVPSQHVRYATGTMLMRWEKATDDSRTEFDFRADGDQWKIYNVPYFFGDK